MSSFSLNHNVIYRKTDTAVKQVFVVAEYISPKEV